MIVCCPKCGRKLTVEPRLYGHLLGCPICMARFAAPDPAHNAGRSGWQGFLSRLLAPFGAVDDDDEDLDEDGDEEMDDDGSGESPSRERQYYDSSGGFAGYRDESGWFHGEGGHNYMGYMEDDGTFYDGSGAYRGQVEEGGLLWEEGKGYTGSHEDSHFSEEGHYGVPDVYEEGGGGTGGAFDGMIDDEDDDDEL